MGDPTTVAGEPQNAGNAKTSGMFARQDLAACKASGFSAKTVSYCSAGDVFCASGQDLVSGLVTHLGYTNTYANPAAAHIAKMVKAA